MENRIDILNELKGLSPVIADMEKVNVFTVPDGYFEMLGENILMNVKEETGALLGSIVNQSSMQVPEGYFENLADSILSKIKIQDDTLTELKELSPMLYNIPNKNVFTVPQGYFENLTNKILSNTGEDNAATELKELSPMLFGIQNKNVFTVPQGYFDSLSAGILNKVKPQQAKVVTMQRRTTTILKYVVAAVFTGAMALGVFNFIKEKVSTDISLTVAQVEGIKIAKENRFDEELAKITDEEVVNFLTKDGVDVEAAVAFTQMEDKIDSDEINNDKTENTEIDELLNQLDENKTMN